MLCPECNHETHVKETRGTMRRRHCSNAECGHRFHTDEMVTDKPMPNLRKKARKTTEARYARPYGSRPAPKSKPVPDAPAQVQSAPQQPERPASFFGRESLVPADVPVTVIEHTPTPAPSFAWLPKLPPAAQGRMR